MMLALGLLVLFGLLLFVVALLVLTGYGVAGDWEGLG